MSSPSTPPGRSAGIAEYVKRAFMYRWNLLAFAGGASAALLSPWPDAMLALLAAGELVYLTQLISSNRFRDAIDSEVYHQSKQTTVVSSQRSIQDLVGGLSPDAKRRFDSLRERCLEMRSIAHGVRGRTGQQPAEDLSTAALDRLLWVFLRLLVSQAALQRFLDKTDVNEIRARLTEARSRLEIQNAADERVVRSLQDSVAVQEMRLDNYERAQKNADFVRIEIDRIEAKIHALTETAVNRQDPDFLSSQIDSVSESMQTTEKAISELQHITGLMDEMEEPPAILEADMPRITH